MPTLCAFGGGPSYPKLGLESGTSPSRAMAAYVDGDLLGEWVAIWRRRPPNLPLCKQSRNHLFIPTVGRKRRQQVSDLHFAES